MAKEWKVIRTDRVEKLGKTDVSKKGKKASKVISKVKTLSLEDLKKEGMQAYDATAARENSILEAYDNKKLKSKALIKEAKTLKKNKEKAVEKNR